MKIERRAKVSIRMEAVGGQGANSAGKILAEAAVLKCGYTGNHFSSFGSEKRGSPVKSFVRFSTDRQTIRTASHVQHPDILVIFHESLMLSHPEILTGSTETTDVIINSAKKPEAIRFEKSFKARTVATVDATALALKNQCGVNAVMLGAVISFCPEIQTDHLQESLKDFFSHKSEKVILSNASGFLAGQAHIQSTDFQSSQAALDVRTNPLPEMGWMNSPIGGVIVNPGNSVLKNHSASRKGVAPLLQKEICFNCGFCDMVCPDFCFVWELDPSGNKKPNLKGIDYQYCKGCQKCIAVCPVEALVPVLENKIPESHKQYKVYPEVDSKKIQERWQHLDWTAYIDKLSEDEKMMTLQTELLNPKSYFKPDFSMIDLIKNKSEEPKK